MLGTSFPMVGSHQFLCEINRLFDDEPSSRYDVSNLIPAGESGPYSFMSTVAISQIATALVLRGLKELSGDKP